MSEMIQDSVEISVVTDAERVTSVVTVTGILLPGRGSIADNVDVWFDVYSLVQNNKNEKC